MHKGHLLNIKGAAIPASISSVVQRSDDKSSESWKPVDDSECAVALTMKASTSGCKLADIHTFCGFSFHLKTASNSQVRKNWGKGFAIRTGRIECAQGYRRRKT